MMAFGWSVGDIVMAIKLVAKVSKAFKDGSGTVAEHEKCVAFLDNLKITLDALKEYIEKTLQAKYSTDIEIHFRS